MRTFRAPLLLALATAIGLIAALWGGAAWAWLSWLGLSAPLGVIAFKIFTSHRV